MDVMKHAALNRRLRRSALVAGLLMLGAAPGCKSTPKMAWWKSDKAAESTAVAHSAPQLPSDAAQASTQFASSNLPPAFDPTSAGGSMPSAYQASSDSVAGTTPGSYPTTGAANYAAGVGAIEATSQVARQSAASSNLGAVPGPYNPDAVPAGVPAAAATTAAAETAPSRYGGVYGSTTPTDSSYADPLASAQTAAASSASAYGSRYATSPTAEPGLPDLSAVADSVATTAGVGGGRYAAASYDAPASYDGASGAAASSAPSTANGATVATAGGYRPGGTSTYPSVGTTTNPSSIASPYPSTQYR